MVLVRILARPEFRALSASQPAIACSWVEIKHVDLDESMVRAIAAQAEAARQRRTKVIHATGEKQAAAELVEATKTLSAEPNAIQLRYLQTLTEIAGDKSSTIVFPLDLIEKLSKITD